ncbi:putative transcriptional regulator with C-terminal CBS domain containing protein [Acidovorax sp. CF316]|uniref:helix-turn-helix domain-containing protein n=1 Tax=Acidovorax sp. CF316 TaxID=1144317 RepID=UPI00026BD355|nr:helix-turn-helix transcriptional regulator [Acidovorax sp. CF316]EJE53370.1 putative transcriptional regulator with C-terminal CBS domain containing protein [Acidovorax sp. CF316]
MTTFSNAFRSEVVRMARKELKPELHGMRKALTLHRSEIAALKREVKTLTSQLKAAQRVVKAVTPPKTEESPQERKGGRKWVFKPEALTAKRAELGVTAKDMAKLLQASPLSLSKWENGQANPRAAQLERIRAVLGLGKRKALALLAEGEGK